MRGSSVCSAPSQSARFANLLRDKVPVQGSAFLDVLGGALAQHRRQIPGMQAVTGAYGPEVTRGKFRALLDIFDNEQRSAK